MLEKDGGWGWVVAAASFLIHMIGVGIPYSSGILYMSVLEKYEGTHFLTALVPACMMASSALAGIPATWVVYLLGYRITVVLGGLLAGGGLALTSLTTELYQVLITMGFITGLGFGLALTPSIMILDTYFHKKRDEATSIAISGVGAGILGFPVLLYHLNDLLDWNISLFILAGICGLISLCGATFKSSHYKGGRPKEMLTMCEFAMWRSPTFVCLALSNIFWSAGVSIIYVYLPSYSILKGLTVQEGVLLISVIGVSNIISRSVYITLTRSAKLDHATVFINCILLTVIVAGLFPELFKQMAGFIGYAIIFGFHTGFWTTFVSQVTVELIGQHYIAYGKGFLALCIAMGLAGGAPVAGLIYDLREDLDVAFYVAGCCLLISASVMFLLNLKSPYYRPPDSWSDTDSMSSKWSRDNELNEESFLITTRVTVL